MEKYLHVYILIQENNSNSWPLNKTLIYLNHPRFNISQRKTVKLMIQILRSALLLPNWLYYFQNL